MLREGYDVIVVGAGSAGCVLAANLSEDEDRSVLLLEAGPDYPRQSLPADLADGTTVPESHDWGFVANARAGGQPLPRGRVVGGSSAINGTSALRGSHDDDAWEQIADHRWAPEAILEGFRRLEHDLDFGDQPWHGSDGPVPVRRPRPDEMSTTSRCFLETAAAAGHALADDLNAPGALGVGPLPLNTIDGLRMSAAITHLEPARHRPNLTIRGDTLVDRIELQGNRSVGVRVVDGRSIHADLVVVAGGTYASPAILLRSGIGSVRHLADHGIDVVVDLPGVGRNLADHPRVSIDVPWTVPVEDGGVFQTMLPWASNGDGPLPDIDIFPAGPFADDEGGHVLALNVALIAPRSRGELRLSGTDPALALDIDPGYLHEPADVERLVAGVMEARRLLHTEPFSSLIAGPPLTPELFDGSADEVRAAIRHSVQSYHNPVGTCRIGEDPGAGAVVDAGGAVYGIERLVVADASVIPKAPRANTNLPTMLVGQAIAERL